MVEIEDEDVLLKNAFVEINAVIKNLNSCGSSSIRELTNSVFANLNRAEKAKIMVFNSMLINIEREKNRHNVQPDLNDGLDDDVPSYIS